MLCGRFCPVQFEYPRLFYLFPNLFKLAYQISRNGDICRGVEAIAAVLGNVATGAQNTCPDLVFEGFTLASITDSKR
jgi:hypothetical protein